MHSGKDSRESLDRSGLFLAQLSEGRVQPLFRRVSQPGVINCEGQMASSLLPRSAYDPPPSAKPPLLHLIPHTSEHPLRLLESLERMTRDLATEPSPSSMASPFPAAETSRGVGGGACTPPMLLEASSLDERVPRQSRKRRAGDEAGCSSGPRARLRRARLPLVDAAATSDSAELQQLSSQQHARSHHYHQHQCQQQPSGCLEDCCTLDARGLHDKGVAALVHQLEAQTALTAALQQQLAERTAELQNAKAQVESTYRESSLLQRLLQTCLEKLKKERNREGEGECAPEDEDAESSRCSGPQVRGNNEAANGATAASSESLQGTCRLCWSKRAVVLLLPCRHLSLCKECQPKAIACPTCMEAFSAHLNVRHE